MLWNTLQPILGEIILAITASQFMLLFGLSKSPKRPDLIRWIGVAGLVAFIASQYITDPTVTETFSGAFTNDSFARFVKTILGIAAIAALLFARPYMQSEKLDRYEYSVLMIYAVIGMSIMASSTNLLTLYIGIEMQSLALYVMAAFNRDSLRASEAGLKYFVLGALSSGLLLYGSSLIYGYSGSLDFDMIARAVATDAGPGLLGGLVFLLCGLAFKISAAPFHMWTPDVYEGAPTPVTGFFAGAPKLAALALIARVLYEPFAALEPQWQMALAILAVLSMVVGALGGLMQSNIKRLMAYSSIANMGYALVALAAGTAEGVEGMLIFMTIYITTVIGVFSIILQMRIRDGMVEQITDLSGLAESNKGLATSLTLLLVSLIGIPIAAGFLGKWYAFGPAIDAGLAWLVVVALIASVVSAFYYLRIIRLMWFAENQRVFVEAPRTLSVFTTLSVIAVLAMMFVPFIIAPGREIIAGAAQSLIG